MVSVVIGTLVLPVVRRRLEDKGLQLSRWLTVALYGVGLFILVVGLFNAGDTSDSEPEVDANEQNVQDMDEVQSSTSKSEADSNEQNTRDKDEVQSSTTQSDPDLKHKVGESFVVGNGDKQARYTVEDVETQKNEASTYVSIDITIENAGDESFDVSSNEFTIMDSQDREFEVDDDLIWDSIFEDEDPIVFDQIHPGTSIEGSIYFEVDPNADGYRLRIDAVGTFSDADSHYVKIEV